MDPITAGIVGGGMGLIGNFMGQNAANAQAQKQMNFQEEMSDTAHQREVADLEAAGLNPILSALGSGASTPGGAMAPIQDFGGSLTSGAKIAQAQQAQNADIDLKHDQSNLLSTQAMTSGHTARNIMEDTNSKKLANKLAEQIMPAMVKKANAEGDWAQVNQFLNAVKTGASSAGQLAPLVP